MPQVNPEHGRQTLRPPQFKLRTLLAVVTACGVLFALGQWLPPMVIAGLAFLAVSIFCHVAGNAIGTRLRAIGDRHEDATEEEREVRIRRPKPQDFAPATQLGQRRSLGWT